MRVLSHPHFGSAGQVFEVFKYMRPIRSSDRDDVGKQSPVQIDIIPIGLQVGLLVNESTAHEGSDVVVDIAQIQLRVLAAIYRNLEQARSELIFFHPFSEFMTGEIDEFTNARVLQHLEDAYETAELIARS